MAAALPDDTKAKVVAALLTGAGVSAVSRELGVPKATVSRIKNSLAAEQLEHIETKKKNRIEELIAKYLEENFETLITHAQLARDPAWFRKQTADSMAVFDGVMADKTLRILEAAVAAQPISPDSIETL